ncbi:NPP1 family protein [Streptomyces sp. HNM0663]|uniref:NPP1 family protein n=1 Tax=Streptomyces chengmaiensis TaxID=3040919 RepID=A0ABT6HJM3_9ACTN|nr:NPP1 family protein [Streptomyces chengmaiensis]MDH2388948.1 NPP1 family protein [Streptomyces chengmaiensis]
MLKSARIRKAPLILAGAFTLVLAVPNVAFAAPPPALPANADTLDRTFQPGYDYDTDGCYAVPAIGPDGSINGGLKTTGSLSGSCRDASDLVNTNGYSRSKCNNGWCAIMYTSYFEKDQAIPGWDPFGHRHDWEHVVVWVQGDEAKYVATSAHGDFDVYPRDKIRWDGAHPKVVYHKDGLSTHCFRPANSNDEPPENHQHTWQYPALVGWNGYPAGLRDKLANADFGSAHFGIKDGSFEGNLAEAKPSGVPFDPYA